MKTYKPWGTYEVVFVSKKYQVKKLTIHPKQSTSLQYHNHRSEHWVVVSGTASVTLGPESKEIQMEEGKHTYIGEHEIHRLANKTTCQLEIIEIQQGNYLGEDDITRLDDEYGRA